MDTRRGFIQIPILVAVVIVGILTVGGGSYLATMKLNEKEELQKTPLTNSVPIETESIQTPDNDELVSLREEINELKSKSANTVISQSTKVIERMAEKPMAQPSIVATPSPLVPPVVVGEDKVFCEKFRSEYDNLIKENIAGRVLINEIVDDSTSLQTSPSIPSVSAIDSWVVLSQKVIEGKSSLLNKVDKLETKIDSLELTTFSDSNFDILKLEYQKWIDAFRFHVNAMIVQAKAVISYQDSKQAGTWGQVESSYQNLKTSEAKTYKTAVSLFSVAKSFDSSLYTSFVNAHAKVGCKWITPGTKNPPTVTLSVSNIGGVNLFGEATKALTWSSSFADSCRGISGSASVNKKWEGVKDSSGTETVSFKRVSDPAIFTISCSNTYGTTNKSVSLYGY